MTLAHRLASRWLARVAAATPLPAKFEPTEPGLLTSSEFLTIRNPQGEFHEAESYDWDLEQMNKDHSLYYLGHSGDFKDRLAVWGNKRGLLLKDDEGRVVGAIYQGTLYHDKWWRSSRFHGGYLTNQGGWVDVGVKKTKVVKYTLEAVAQVSNIARNNLANYPVVLQNIQIKGEPFQVRSEGTLEEGGRTTIVILNSAGLKVASAQDEWGATLLVVAQEFRGRGLGKIIGKFWYKWNPNTPSGGFTSTGQANALRLWADRVREFLGFGWYSELVREGRMTVPQVKRILADLHGKRPKTPLFDGGQAKVAPKVLALVDYPSFVVYDQAFYADPDDKHIYAHGFFRGSEEKSFLYTIDYDRKFAKFATAIALQMARDEGRQVYVGEGYGDTLEWDLINQVESDASGDYVALTGDILNLSQLARLEKMTRRKHDQYDEKYMLLLEMAESKWS